MHNKCFPSSLKKNYPKIIHNSEQKAWSNSIFEFEGALNLSDLKNSIISNTQEKPLKNIRMKSGEVTFMYVIMCEMDVKRLGVQIYSWLHIFNLHLKATQKDKKNDN